MQLTVKVSLRKHCKHIVAFLTLCHAPNWMVRPFFKTEYQ